MMETPGAISGKILENRNALGGVARGGRKGD